MSAELIGIIAASIALGTAWLASIRSLRQDLRDLRADMKAMEGGIREDMKAMESGLRAEMRAGFKELTERVTGIGDRLSKVEGIIEGMFWSGRSQPPDKPREGAA